ncbi:hypothetical protein, partial [Xylanibacter rodentium]|uniref:hypothetical protein n=1 Tax=Xylanibacter rodentium TaxID=2736289 RepID=UPI00258AEACF
FCPFRARGVTMYDSRGAATLCPGLCACCPVGAHLSEAHPSGARWYNVTYYSMFILYPEDNVV